MKPADDVPLPVIGAQLRSDERVVTQVEARVSWAVLYPWWTRPLAWSALRVLAPRACVAVTDRRLIIVCTGGPAKGRSELVGLEDVEWKWLGERVRDPVDDPVTTGWDIELQIRRRKRMTITVSPKLEERAVALYQAVDAPQQHRMTM